MFLETFNSPDPWHRRHSPEPAGVSDHARVGEDLGNDTYTTVSRLSDQGQGTSVPRSIRPARLTAIG